MTQPSIKELKAFKQIIKEECAYKGAYSVYEPHASLLPTCEHFIQRFIERVEYNEESFRRLIRAFIGMLQVRRKYYVDYVAKNPSVNEHTYNWRGHEIRFTTTRGVRTQFDEDGKCATIKLITII